MDQPPAEGTPHDAADAPEDEHARTLTDLLDELDRAAFRRSLAHRDRSPHLRCTPESPGYGRK